MYGSGSLGMRQCMWGLRSENAWKYMWVCRVGAGMGKVPGHLLLVKATNNEINSLFPFLKQLKM